MRKAVKRWRAKMQKPFNFTVSESSPLTFPRLFLCPHSPVYSIDSGHFQTAVVEVELSRWVHGQGLYNGLRREG